MKIPSTFIAEPGRGIGKARTGEPPRADASPASAEDGLTKKWSEAQNAAAEFETLFMDLIVKGMRQTAKPEDASNASEIYTGMLDSEYAKVMTGSQSFGVRDMILDWMKSADPTLAQAGKELHRAKAQGQALEAYRVQAGALPTK